MTEENREGNIEKKCYVEFNIKEFMNFISKRERAIVNSPYVILDKWGNPLALRAIARYTEWKKNQGYETSISA